LTARPFIAGIFDRRAAGEPRGVSLSADGAGCSSYRDDRLSVVADARLDCPVELARQLGQPRDASPARLIAQAYRAWGGAFIDALEGDFAFAIHDAESARLVCARDRFGVRPLHFSSSGSRFAFASSIVMLRGISDLGRSLRQQAIADFILGRVGDTEGTFFEGIKRLPAAHIVTVDAERRSLHRYWSLQPDPQAEREPDAPSRFRELFGQAVGCRMREASRPAALLSGGLDSSSIACIARDQHGNGPGLETYSLHFSEPERCNERRFIEAVLDQGGFRPTIMSGDDYRPFERHDELLKVMGGPVLAPNLACMRPLIERARDGGVDVLLDGHGGDEVVSHGYGRLDDLARSGSWLALWKEAAAAADNYGRPTPFLVRRIAGRHRGLDARLVGMVLARLSPESVRTRLPTMLRRDVIEACDFSSGASPCPPDAGEREQHLATLESPLQAYAFEVLAQFYRAHGIEPRFPFWDRRLVEFCVGLPGSAKLAGGWSRLVLREAMAGVIPDMVRTRRDKVDFGFHLAQGMVRHHDGMIRDLLGENAGGIGDYVDLTAARALYEEIATEPADAAGPKVQQAWRLVTMAYWLDGRPTATDADRPAAMARAPVGAEGV